VKLSVDQVRHVARLAELAVTDAQAERLTRELAGIVAFVETLGELEDDSASHVVVVGPEQVSLRDDVIAPIPMAHPPAAIAPAFVDGFFVVPRLGGLAEE
jgi:aspartyl-tRNA(Asn)/glutamyl-tRNA(Gln) amidotransferase subunit C